jgi:hypothetical protein
MGSTRPRPRFLGQARSTRNELPEIARCPIAAVRRRPPEVSVSTTIGERLGQRVGRLLDPALRQYAGTVDLATVQHEQPDASLIAQRRAHEGAAALVAERGRRHSTSTA